MIRSGGKIEKRGSVETFVIPMRTPKPSKYEPSWQPGPIANSRYTAKEMEQIDAISRAVDVRVQKDLDEFAPGWKIKRCTEDMPVGLLADYRGRENVLATHPPMDGECILSRKVAISGATSALHLGVGHHPDGDWDLIVRANGKELLKKTIGKESAPDGWIDLTVDLSAYAGKTINLELFNKATGWAFEGGFWSKIEIGAKG